MIKNLTKGDLVWFVEEWTGCSEQGQVQTLTDDSAEIKGITTIGTRTLPLSHLFSTKRAADKHITDVEAATIRDYKAGIQSLEDLIAFMYTHNVCPCEEYTDWTARRVAKEKAMEFGVELCD